MTGWIGEDVGMDMATPRFTTGEKVIDPRAMVAFLCDALSVGATSPVTTIETHKSWVFLTDRYAFKLKKAIRYDSVDFRPLAARFANCQEELRLNRRLASDVYLDIVPLTIKRDGNLSLSSDGEPVDWLVKMRRLPDELMLDRMILDGTLHEEDVNRLVSRLVGFYQSEPPAIVDGVAFRTLLRRELEFNRRDLSGVGNAAEVIDSHFAFLEREADMLDERASAGHVVEGHGDLRPEHICLEPNPAIVDCLEFDSRLRTADAVDELAFLALQCERLGAAWVGAAIIDRYRTTTSDAAPAILISFYKSYRAAIWARLAIWRARDACDDSEPKWRARANQFLELSAVYAGQMR